MDDLEVLNENDEERLIQSLQNKRAAKALFVE